MSDNKAVFIIAEAGVNHNGSLELAKKLVLAAKYSGSNAVKFQTFKAEKLVRRDVKQAAYQTVNTGIEESQYEMLKRLELSDEEHEELNRFCTQQNIKFMSTAFDLDSIDFLASLKMDIWKIASGEITNVPYLRKVAVVAKEIILSTGMSTLEEVEFAANTIKSAGFDLAGLTLLHATSEYPCPVEEVNLKAMLTLKDKFNLRVGYSDHTQGIHIPFLASAMGAEVIEKHFTLDRTLEGPDHKSSLEPRELLEMVTHIRQLPLVLGTGEKKPSISESKNIVLARKYIVTKQDIKAGDIFSDTNLNTMRAGGEISARYWDDVIGKISSKDYMLGDKINLEELNK